MENNLFNLLQSEVEIAKCRKYQSELIEQTIDELDINGASDHEELLDRARALGRSSLYFYDFSLDQFEYFKTALIRVLEERQPGRLKISSGKS